MLPETREGRPGVGTVTASKSSTVATYKNTSIVPSNSGLLADLDALADALSGRFVVQVAVDSGHGHRRTTVYRSAAAAERAVLRARERGRSAHCSLVQMVPVGVVVGLGGGGR